MPALFRVCLFVTSILAMIVAACAQAQPTPTPTFPVDLSTIEEDPTLGTAINAETFEVADCPFGGNRSNEENEEDDDDIPGPWRNIVCGYLTVPEDYDQPSGETLRLFAVVFKTRSQSPQPDPVIFHFGFPMTSNARYMPFYFDKLYASRDLIFFDARGMGASEPSLACPGLTRLFQENLQNPAIPPQAYTDAYRACRTELTANTANLLAFSNRAAAQDLRALRLALGYQEWNVMAMAMGATQTLEALRTDPLGVRSMLLISPIPPSPKWYQQPMASQAALSQYFGLCAADEACAETFPDVEKVFYEVVDELNSRPIALEAADTTHGKRYQVTVNGDRLIELALAIVDDQTSGITPGEMPRMIFQVQAGKTDVLSKMMGAYISAYNNDFGGLMSYNHCLDIQQWAEGDAESGFAALNPTLADYYQWQWEINQAICEAWGPFADTPEPEALASAPVPMLFLAGERSWQIPRAWTDELALNFPNAQIGIYPNAGVSVMFSEMWQACTKYIVESFFLDPGAPVDMACLAEERKITWITLR
jgi:pimeloyl-ACP methyl ester carboxylesterase